MMRDLLRFNWRSFEIKTGVKISLGLLVMLILTELTGESWLTTALVALFAWLANYPGQLKDRIQGMTAFGFGAAALTVVHGLIEVAVWPNVLLVMITGFFGTLALIWGMRAFMVGYALICWAIYGPLMVATTSVSNCLLAIVVGTGVLVILNTLGEKFFNPNKPEQTKGEAKTNEPLENRPDLVYIIGYATTVALVLGLTTYFGWVELKTDPSLMAGGAFFVIGFDRQKTWAAGIGRVIGLFGGSLLGLFLAHLLEAGTALNLVMIVACGLSFAAARVHPGGWMFFFMVFVAIGWHGMEPDTSSLTIRERFYGELWGIAAAMVAIVFLQWWQTYHQNKKR